MIDINSKPFDNGTVQKLEIFEEYFKEWFPVFVNSFNKRLYIYDFFAGTGKDTTNNYGTPLLLLNSAKGNNCQHCHAIRENHPKSVEFIFNEYDTQKLEKLKHNVNVYLDQCQQQNCHSICIYSNKIYYFHKNFCNSFKDNKNLQDILSNRNYAKFILLDQYGYTKVDKDIFRHLVNSPTTDFIFFIASSYLSRFRNHENTRKYFDTSLIEFNEKDPRSCHKIIAQYFESLLPPNKEYYISHFTIKKGSNYYGIIFGTGHTLGMEKMQNVLWKIDARAGESNCNIEHDYDPDSLFGNSIPNKIRRVQDLIIKKIFEGKITNNISGFKFTLQQKCRPIVFTNTIKELERQHKIIRVGSSKYISNNIHKIKESSDSFYSIELVKS